MKLTNPKAEVTLERIKKLIKDVANCIGIWKIPIQQELKLCSIDKAEKVSAEATELAKIFASSIMTSSKNLK
jgi:hypothetical protein